MNTKLTLSIEESVIERAKAYAKSKNRSLSEIIERYLDSITSENMVNDMEITPFVKSISSGVSIPDDLDYKEEYRKHIEKKHK